MTAGDGPSRRKRRPRQEQPAHEPPLFGLLLAGGRSSRMGRDKASLVVSGRTLPQLRFLFTELSAVCDKAFVSARGRPWEASWPELPRIEDSYPEVGPMAGVLTAMALTPSAAWLVTAVDLVNVTRQELSVLAAARDARADATAVFNAAIASPEPLLAIYEPRAFAALRQSYERGDYSLRKALSAMQVKQLRSLPPEAVQNVNSPEEIDPPEQ